MSDKLKIITNYHKYPLLHYYELSPKWQRKAKKEFDWDDNLEDESEMFIYRNWLYHLSDFMRYGPGSISGKMPEVFKDWDSYSNDSFFSGIVIRYAKDEYGYEENNQGNYLLQIGTFYG